MKLRCLAIALTLLATFASDSWGQSQQSPKRNQPQTQTKEAQQPAAADERGTEKTPLVVRVLNPPQDATQPAKQGKADEDKPSTDWYMFGATVVLAFIALLQLAAFIVQARRLGQTIGVMKDTAMRQLRAYAHVADVVMSEMNSGFNPHIQVIIKNFGQTPARQIVNTHEVKVALNPSEGSFGLDRAKKGEIVDLAPDQKTFSSFTIPFNQWAGMKPDLSTKTQEFYVFGRIDYVDVFNEPRWTEYRYKLRVDTRGILDETSLVVDGHAGNRAS